MNTETTITAPAGWTICEKPGTSLKKVLEEFIAGGAECVRQEFESNEAATKTRRDLVNCMAKYKIGGVEIARRQNVVYIKRK